MSRPARSLARSNSEREAVIAYAEKRIVQYKARGCGEAAQAFGVFIADLDAELHISPLAGQHQAQRQSDEYFCAKCGKRWAVSDDAPEACA